MTDPKNSENQSEELPVDELEGVAAGVRVEHAGASLLGESCTVQCQTGLKDKSETNTFLKSNVSGSANPGGDDI